MNNEILNFINRRFKIDCNWTNGNCLWFAIILNKRFPQSQVYYLPIEGHFIIKYEDNFYDFTGIITPKEKPILFDEIKQTDKLWYNCLIRDCFM